MESLAALEDASLFDVSNITNLTSPAEPTEESSVYLMLDINFYTVPLLCLLGILGARNGGSNFLLPLLLQ